MCPQISLPARFHNMFFDFCSYNAIKPGNENQQLDEVFQTSLRAPAMAPLQKIRRHKSYPRGYPADDSSWFSSAFMAMMLQCKQRILAASPLPFSSKSSYPPPHHHHHHHHHQNDSHLHNSNENANYQHHHNDIEGRAGELPDGDGVVGQSWNGLMWRQRVEDLLWLASSCFILYYGDLETNFFSLLANDPRVWRTPLNIGLASLFVNSCIILYVVVSEMRTHKARIGFTTTGVIEATTLIGLLAFTLLSVALWPIWSFLTIPMLVTLFMGMMVVVPYVLPFTKLKPKSESPRPLDG